MKNLEIGNTLRKLGKYGRMLALTGTIGASSIFFTGCGPVDAVKSWVQGKEDKEAPLEDNGKILQLLRLNSGESCEWKVGYFSLDEKEGNLHFIDTYEKDDTNLTYLLTISDNIEVKYCDYANVCNTEILLSGKLFQSQSNDILDIDNLEDNNTTSITSISEFSCKKEVILKDVKNSSYDEIIENTSFKKAPVKTKK